MNYWEYRLIAGFLFVLLPSLLLGQVRLSGRIVDADNGEPLISAGIRIENGNGGLTDTEGLFSVPAAPGSQTIAFSFPGYDTLRRTVVIGDTGLWMGMIRMKARVTELEQVVVTGSRMEQKVDQMPVSTDVIRTRTIDQLSVSSVVPVLEQTPGLTIQDDQPGIRGSSGYAYGAGSRVMIMLDGLPMLSGDAGFSQFDMLPVDNIHQIEVIKGASSVLYGSSALGGVINVRTSRPGLQPKTSVRVRTGLFDRPANPALKWDRNDPGLLASGHFFHSRRICNLDFTAAVDLVRNPGYRQDDRENSARFIGMFKYHFPKIPGLWVSLNVSAKADSSRNFLYWASYEPRKIPLGLGSTDSVFSGGGLTPAPGTVRLQLLRRLAVDPALNYTTSAGNQHQYRGRVLVTDNQNNTNQNSTATVYFNEYLYQHLSWKKRITTSAGVNYTYSTVNADSLYGDHYSNSAAVFVQTDVTPHPRWILNAGWRYQWVQIDKLPEEQSPVYRAGASYRVHKASFFRASWGQGFRVPSIAERFTATTAGGVIVVPNPILKNEKGYSAELGFRQGLAFRKWKGFVDAALFRMDFKDMIEFNVFSDSILKNFAVINSGVPFRSLNVSHARIEGYEITTGFQGKIGNVGIEGGGGYTFTNPRDLNGLPPDSVMDLRPGSIKTFNELVRQIGLPDRPEVLKYRNRHLFKGTLGLSYRAFSLTAFYRYGSQMTGFDQPLYIVVNDLVTFMEKHSTGYSVMDVNFSVRVKKQEIFLLVNNLWNEEYLIVPGYLAEQRRFTLQYKIVF